MEHLIDLDRYPLDRLDDGAGRALVARCIDDLARRGMFTLAGLLRAEVIERMLPDLLARAAAEAYTHAREHNIYFDDDVAGVPRDHPALTRVRTVNHTLCGDQLGDELRALYEWPPLAAFLARVMGKPALYPMADPLACANVMTYYEGEGLNWHFDRRRRWPAVNSSTATRCAAPAGRTSTVSRGCCAAPTTRSKRCVSAPAISTCSRASTPRTG